MENMFKFCPNCKSENTTFKNDHLFTCLDCNFIYYNNVATAVAVIIRNEGKILFSIRNNEPMKGHLDLPGGFVDPGESAEEAAKRELEEELNLTIDNLTYFTSEQNHYKFENVTYRTCDICFIADINHTNITIDPSEIQGIEWLKPNEIDLSKIGFDSLRKVTKKYLETL